MAPPVLLQGFLVAQEMDVSHFLMQFPMDIRCINHFRGVGDDEVAVGDCDFRSVPQCGLRHVLVLLEAPCTRDMLTTTG